MGIAGLSSAFATSYPVKRNGPGTQENQGESEGCASQGELESALAEQAVLEVHFEYGDQHVNEDGECRHTGKQAEDDQDAAAEFGGCHHVCHPLRDAEVPQKAHDAGKVPCNFLPAVGDHDCAQCQSHDQQCQRLQPIEIAQLDDPRSDSHGFLVELLSRFDPIADANASPLHFAEEELGGHIDLLADAAAFGNVATGQHL